MKTYIAIFALLQVNAISVASLRGQDQEHFSADGEPLHGIVGWDDIHMKPTQKEEDGKRTNAADDDDFQKCMF